MALPRLRSDSGDPGTGPENGKARCSCSWGKHTGLALRVLMLGGREMVCGTPRHGSPKEATAKQPAVLLSQAGRNGEELQRIFNFRPLAFFYPSTFCKYLMPGIVSFWVKFLRGAKWTCFSLRGRLCPLPRAERYLLTQGERVENQWVCTEI